jgi:acetolactate synthase-1/2/3 large subunit
VAAATLPSATLGGNFSRIAAATGARLITDTFISRLQRGAGRVNLLRLPYFGEQAAEMLAGTSHLILIGTQAPITFAYPGKPHWLTPDGCSLHTLVERQGDIDERSRRSARRWASPAPMRHWSRRSGRPCQRRTEPAGHRRAVGHLLPENAIVVDEGGTSAYHHGHAARPRTTGCS